MQEVAEVSEDSILASRKKETDVDSRAGGAPGMCVQRNRRIVPPPHHPIANLHSAVFQ